MAAFKHKTFTRVVSACFVGLVGCGPGFVVAQTSSTPQRYGDPVAVCQITDPRLDEASGLVASRRTPGCYYTHNDSQGQPHVYVLNRHGRIQATVRLIGAENRDWEDIALAPGEKPDTYDVCVADIGDNRAQRAEIVVYRFPEPELQTATGGTIDLHPTTIRCKYEDGPINAEGFAVDPRTGDGYVFSKNLGGPCRVYRLPAPWSSEGVTTLKPAGTLKFPPAPPLMTIVTAADVAADGLRLVTRSYAGGWEWRLPPDTGVDPFARIFEQDPTPLTLAAEPQGEALCFSPDGSSLLTISEKTPTTLYEVRLVRNEPSGKP